MSYEDSIIGPESLLVVGVQKLWETDLSLPSRRLGPNLPGRWGRRPEPPRSDRLSVRSRLLWRRGGFTRSLWDGRDRHCLKLVIFFQMLGSLCPYLVSPRHVVVVCTEYRGSGTVALASAVRVFSRRALTVPKRTGTTSPFTRPLSYIRGLERRVNRSKT